MIKLIKNGTVITMDSNREKKYEKLDIVIKDDTIVEITEEYSGEYDILINAYGKVVMPGLINAHTHLGMSIFRASNDNLILNDWLNKKIWPIEHNMSVDDVYYTSLLSCIEMIKTGTVMANDMYINSEGTIKALKETKVRCLYGYNLMDNNDNGDENINIFESIYNKYKNDDLIKFSVAPHAMYTCSKDYLRKCSDLALKYNLPVHIHFSENQNEVAQIIKDYCMDPVKVLSEVGLFRNKLILAHGTYISDRGLVELQDKNVSIVHNPISNLNLGCGIADVKKYRDYINICLGTDGQGSGNNMNLFYHMSVVDLLQKGLYKNPTVWSCYETLKMSTINGAKALGVDDLIGSIEVGKKADIIILNLNHNESYPSSDLITNVVHNAWCNCVETTLVNGEILFLEKKLKIDIDEKLLKNKIDNIVNRLFK